MSTHPFDRYAAFTDIEALKAISQKPLRKCLRVNGLKSSPEAVRAWGEKHGWKLERIPWCSTGFFVDRENRETALGKDLLHLLGHTYMQEASSMLPPVLLDPKPGEVILDMSAAPGSKTTQIAAAMQNTGVLVANDVQEKRLWTLKAALYRAGTVNTLVTKKVGQWFARNMTERFDRVLCDAPCTGQGTSRKNPEALDFCSMDSIEGMARLQIELLEAAIHATKIGGRIVYSTCTLTPEENEQVIHTILNKFSDQVSVLDPRQMSFNGSGGWDCSRAVEDSMRVQKELAMGEPVPLIRIWPHVHDAEGFFCAVLEKRASTMQRERRETVFRQERPVLRMDMAKIDAYLEDIYGTPFRTVDEQIWSRSDQYVLVHKDAAEFPLPVADYSMGLPFAKGVKNSRFRITHELATLRGALATKNCLDLDPAQMTAILAGKDTSCPPELKGDIVLKSGDTALGVGLAQEGILKNRLSRWLVQHTGE